MVKAVTIQTGTASRSQDPLQACLYSWSLQTVSAATDLLRLYTQLGDPQQRDRSLRILEAGKARLAQYPALIQGTNPGPPLPLEDVEAELRAWESTLEATIGVLVFLTLAQDAGKPVLGLRGQISKFTRASAAALQGLLRDVN